MPQTPFDWNIVIALSGSIAALALILTAAFALTQWRAAIRAARCAAWIEAQRVFTTKRFTRTIEGETDPAKKEVVTWLFGEARGKVMAMERPVPAEEWAKSPVNTRGQKVTLDEAFDVCRGMCEVADLVVFGGLDLKFVLRAWGDPFRKTWIVLGPLVRSEQETFWRFRWERFEFVGEAAVKRFGWPTNWKQPATKAASKQVAQTSAPEASAATV
jgi:hypothetical protein